MKDWLDFIFPGYGFIELRAIRDGDVKQRWFEPRGIDHLIRSINHFDDTEHDVYVGVLPRKDVAGTADDVWPTGTILWCDVDAKDFNGDILDQILRFPVPPSCIIDSGHGYHLYWKILSADTGDVVEANKAIAKWLGGDKCFDAPRILRVPGTHNRKDPANPIPVRILKLDTLRLYDLSDFNEMIEALHSDDRPRRDPSGGRREDAPDWLRDLINEEPPKGQRSETEFRAGLWLARYGYEDDEIDTILSNSPVGAKYQERSDRWRQGELQRIRSKA